MATIEIEGAEDPNFLQLNDGNAEWNNNLLNQDDSIIKEYFNQISGIGMAINALEDLNAIKEKVDNSPELDTHTLKIAKIAIENITSRFDISLAIPSLESIDTREVALEGLSSAVQKIFEAIWKAIQRVIDFFLGLFKAKKEVARKHLFEKLKILIDENAKNNRQPKEAVGQIKALSRLGIEGDSIGIQELYLQVHFLNATVELIRRTLHDFKKYIINLDNFMKIYADKGDLPKEELMKMNTSLLDAESTWSEFLHKSLNRSGKDITLYVDGLTNFKQSKGLQGLKSEIRSWTDFVDGKILVGVLKPNEKFGIDEVVTDVISVNRDASVFADKIKFPTAQELKTFFDHSVVDLGKNEDKLMGDFKDAAEALDKLCPRTDSFVSHHPGMKENEVTTHVSRRLSVHLAMYGRLLELTVNSVKAVEMAVNSVALQYK